MTIQELRIGNWISTYNETDIRVTYCQVTALDLELISTTDGFGFYNGYSGILLTPEILEKAGFRPHYAGGREWSKDYEEGIPTFILTIDKYLNGIYYTGDDGCYYSQKLQYLHQLQNLYFSLTQTELNIQL